MLNRRGVTLIEILVTSFILAVLGLVVYQNEANASKVGGDVARTDQAARVLAELADAMGRNTGSGSATSFSQYIGSPTVTNPGRLSHLTAPITSSMLNSCMYNYSTAQAGRWVTPFYHRILPTTGVQLAPGYFAQDSLIRFDAAGVPITVANRPAANDATSYGTLAIVMPSVSASDALALANRVEGDPNGISGAVRYTPNGASNVVMNYHFNIRGC